MIPVMNLVQFAVATGGTTTADVDSHIHAGLRSKPKTKTHARFYAGRLAELQAKRDETEESYRAALAAGTVLAPAKLTLEEKAARGGSAGEAAARLIAKKAARLAAEGASLC